MVYSKVIQLCVHIYPFFFRFFSHIDYYRLLSRVPCAINNLGLTYTLLSSETCFQSRQGIVNKDFLYSTVNCIQYPDYFENMFQRTFNMKKMFPQTNPLNQEQKSLRGEMEQKPICRPPPLALVLVLSQNKEVVQPLLINNGKYAK